MSIRIATLGALFVTILTRNAAGATRSKPAIFLRGPVTGQSHDCDMGPMRFYVVVKGIESLLKDSDLENARATIEELLDRVRSQPFNDSEHLDHRLTMVLQTLRYGRESITAVVQELEKLVDLTMSHGKWLRHDQLAGSYRDLAGALATKPFDAVAVRAKIDACSSGMESFPSWYNSWGRPRLMATYMAVTVNRPDVAAVEVKLLVAGLGAGTKMEAWRQQVATALTPTIAPGTSAADALKVKIDALKTAVDAFPTDEKPLAHSPFSHWTSIHLAEIKASLTAGDLPPAARELELFVSGIALF